MKTVIKIPKSKFYIAGEPLEVEIPDQEIVSVPDEPIDNFHKDALAALDGYAKGKEAGNRATATMNLVHLALNELRESEKKEEEILHEFFPDAEFTEARDGTKTPANLKEEIFLEAVWKLIELGRNAKLELQDYIDALENTIKEKET